MRISVIIISFTENSKMNDEFPHITVQHELLERNIGFSFNAERCKNAGLNDIPDAEKYELIKLRRVYHFNKDTPDSIIFTIPEPIFLLVNKGTDLNNPHGYLGNQCVIENSANENEDVTNKGTKRRLNSASTTEDEIIIEHIPGSLPKKANRLQTLERSHETSWNTKENEIVDNNVTSEDTYSYNCNALGKSKVMSNLTFEVVPLGHVNNMSNEPNKNNPIEVCISTESKSNRDTLAACSSETTKIDLEILDEMSVNEIIIDDRKAVSCQDFLLQENIKNPSTSKYVISEYISQSKDAGDFQPYVNSVLEEHSYNARILFECNDGEKMSKSVNDTKTSADETTMNKLPEASKLQNTSLSQYAEHYSKQISAAEEKPCNNNGILLGDNDVEPELGNEDTTENFNGKNDHHIQSLYVEQNNNKTKPVLDCTPENTSTNVNLSDQDLIVIEPYPERFKISDSDFMGFTKEEQTNDRVNMHQFYHRKIENLCEEIENNIYTIKSFENVDLYKCSTCNFKVEKLSHLQMHIRSHIEPYWCNMCLDMFSSATKLQDHVRNCHDIGRKSKKSIERVNSDKCVTGEKPFKRSTNVKMEIYKCGYCNYSSASLKRLRYHMRVHDKERLYYCDRCNFTTLTEWIMECHMDAHDTEQHECSECGYISMYKEELSLHMQIHTKEKKFKCDQCSFSTSHLGYFNAHSSFHPRVDTDAETVDNRKAKKLYRCEKCDYVTKQQRMLYRHDKRMHGDNKALIRSLVLPESETKLHMCVKCGFWAQTENAFMKHMTIHEDEKPYKCHLCNFISNTKCDLDIHSKNHFEQECYRCTMCNCKFLTMKELENHSKDCSHIADSTKNKLSRVGENT